MMRNALLIVLSTIIVAILIVYIVGTQLPVKHTATVTAELAHPTERVYAMIRDHATYPQWRRSIASVTTLTEDSWTEVYDSNDSITFGVVEEDVNSRLIIAILDENLPFGGRWTYTVSGESTTSMTIVEEGEVYSPFFRFISHYFMDPSATMQAFISDLDRALSGD